MTLTIITIGKNDNYAGNFVQRIEHNVNKLISNIDNLLIDDVEIIVSDWGSSEDERLSDVMKVENRNYLKFLHTPLEITKKYSPNSGFSIPHAYNSAIRRTKGKFILLIDADGFFTEESFKKLYDLIKKKSDDEYIFYWINRVMIPYADQSSKNDIDGIQELINNWIESGRVVVSGQDYLNGLGWCRSGLNINNFAGGAVAILLSRNICEESTFFYEKLNKWGWMDVEYHQRLSSKYPCQGELSQLFELDFFHIGHHEMPGGGLINGENSYLKTSEFRANGENWGLFDEDIKIYQK
jgi:hypothetical protein